MTMIYLNHAGTSWPKPPAAVAAAESVFRTDPTDWPELFAESHRTVADFFHVPSPRLLLTPSCTAALQLAVDDHPWQAGDRVLTSHFEHHAMQRSLVKLAERGVDVITLPYSDDEPILLDALEAELTKGSVRLLAITAACNVTGRLLPIAEAIALAHRFDALALIDGAQIAGWSDLDIPALGADLFTFAGHKGPQSPWGIGGLYVRPDLPMQCPTAVCDIAERKEAPSAAMPGYCDAGSVNLSALAGLAAACQWLAEPAQQDRLATTRKLAATFTEAVRPMRQVTVYHDVPMAGKVPTVAISVEGTSTTELGNRLREQGVMLSAGFQCAPQAHTALGTTESGVLRFSFGPSSRVDEVEQAIAILGDVLASD